IIGRLVLYCIEKGVGIEELSIEELKEISDKFEPDIYDAVSLKTCVEKRLTLGAPGPGAMQEIIRLHKIYLEEEWQKGTEKDE
ncbi:MAG: argininosuccinate lyase, partial [Lachnospiraceae bacterium]|nr:argininosuccinate lyase [Lachnospiraceae bacterium]